MPTGCPSTTTVAPWQSSTRTTSANTEPDQDVGSSTATPWWLGTDSLDLMIRDDTLWGRLYAKDYLKRRSCFSVSARGPSRT